TSWTSPNEAYEAGVRSFVERILSSGEFLSELRDLAGRTSHAGRISSLAQVAVKCAAPGVPDVYQGCELWDLSLVDPDNRRPVDFERRSRALAEIDAELARGPAARAALARRLSTEEGLEDGRAKLLLLRVALRLRQAMRELFLEGDYLPLAAEGPLSRRVFAFARMGMRRALVCAVPRLVLRPLDEGGGRIPWEGSLRLAKGLPRRWRDAVTGAEHEGGEIALADLFAGFPVALLVSEVVP
ncbi:MAG TPA: malto-oligosyltrehalose synthase, partial [Anaeromyxobacter sp.]